MKKIRLFVWLSLFTLVFGGLPATGQLDWATSAELER